MSPPGRVGTSVLKIHLLLDVAADGTIDRDWDVPRMWTTEDERIDCAVRGCRFVLDQEDLLRSPVVPVSWAPEWSPWPTAGAFVDDAYAALLDRAPTPGERSSAIAGLTDRNPTGRALLRTLAARSDAVPVAEVVRLYQAAFGRRPDAAGLRFWVAELERTSAGSVATRFGTTAEFRATYGSSVSDATAVERAYARTLGRAPDPDGSAYWVGRLEAGMYRSRMIHLFSRTPEFLDRERARSEVTSIHVALLGEVPSAEAWHLLGVGSVPQPSLAVRADDIMLALLGSDELAATVD